MGLKKHFICCSGEHVFPPRCPSTFCNDMHLLPFYGRIILFTDDTNLLCSHRDKFLEFMLKHDMNSTFWFRANQLSLNMAKTVLMTFWDTLNMNVIVDNTVILHVEQTKFLGVILDRQLTWRNHTNTLYNKIIANRLLLLKSKIGPCGPELIWHFGT